MIIDEHIVVEGLNGFILHCGRAVLNVGIRLIMK